MRSVLHEAEYGVLSMVAKDGEPYCIPLSYLYHEGAVYFHCAQKGLKIDCMHSDDRVCFVVVQGTKPVLQRGNFTTLFESVILHGAASEISDPVQKRELLLLLCNKYLPKHMDSTKDALDRSLAITAVWKITPNKISGKAKH